MLTFGMNPAESRPLLRAELSFLTQITMLKRKGGFRNL